MSVKELLFALVIAVSGVLHADCDDDADTLVLFSSCYSLGACSASISSADEETHVTHHHHCRSSCCRRYRHCKKDAGRVLRDIDVYEKSKGEILGDALQKSLQDLDQVEGGRFKGMAPRRKIKYLRRLAKFVANKPIDRAEAKESAK